MHAHAPAPPKGARIIGVPYRDFQGEGDPDYVLVDDMTQCKLTRGNI